MKRKPRDVPRLQGHEETSRGEALDAPTLSQGTNRARRGSRSYPILCIENSERAIFLPRQHIAELFFVSCHVGVPGPSKLSICKRPPPRQDCPTRRWRR